MPVLSRSAPEPAPELPAGKPVLKLRNVWRTGDFGFGDIGSCDDYYVETVEATPRTSQSPARGTRQRHA